MSVSQEISELGDKIMNSPPREWETAQNPSTVANGHGKASPSHLVGPKSEAGDKEVTKPS